MFVFRYEDVLFSIGDKLLLTFINEYSREKSFMELLFADGESYDFPDGEEERILDESGDEIWKREPNGDISFDLSNPDSLGFFIGGEENIFPAKVRVLAEGEAGIDLTGLTNIDIDNVKAGDRLVVKAYEDEYITEFTITKNHLKDLKADEGQLYETPVGMSLTFNGGKYDHTILGVRK